MKSKLKQYAFIGGTFVFMLVCFFFASVSMNAAAEKYAKAEQDVKNIENDIDRLKNKEKDKIIVEKEVTTGLNENRWHSDDTKMLEWVKPAFTFNSPDEYNKNRDLFIQRLGPDDSFVKDIMPPFIQGVTVYTNEEQNIDEGDKLNMEVRSFTSYVKSIDEENGIYSYVAFVVTSSSNKNGYTGESTVIMTYSMDEEGNVSDFVCCIPGQR